VVTSSVIHIVNELQTDTKMMKMQNDDDDDGELVSVQPPHTTADVMQAC